MKVKICPKCGKQNFVGISFCANSSCKELLTIETISDLSYENIDDDIRAYYNLQLTQIKMDGATSSGQSPRSDIPETDELSASRSQLNSTKISWTPEQDKMSIKSSPKKIPLKVIFWGAAILIILTVAIYYGIRNDTPESRVINAVKTYINNPENFLKFRIQCNTFNPKGNPPKGIEIYQNNLEITQLSENEAIVHFYPDVTIEGASSQCIVFESNSNYFYNFPAGCFRLENLGKGWTLKNVSLIDREPYENDHLLCPPPLSEENRAYFLGVLSVIDNDDTFSAKMTDLTKLIPPLELLNRHLDLFDALESLRISWQAGDALAIYLSGESYSAAISDWENAARIYLAHYGEQLSKP
jgi:hypothetical protein